MKKIYALKQGFVLSTALLFFTHYIQAQNIFPSTGSAGIGTTTPNASSVLDMVSTLKGILIPRMTITQRNAIKTPATGLLIYQTNSAPGFYYYNGNKWMPVTPKANEWSLTGNSGTIPGTNFIGTTDAQPLVFKVNNQSAGYLGTSSTANTAFGYQTLNANTSGIRNTAVGAYADVGSNNLTNATAIGYGAIVSTSNSLVLGSGANVGIGTSNPSSKLHVVGVATITQGLNVTDGSIYAYGPKYGIQATATGTDNTYGVYGVGYIGVYGESSATYGTALFGSSKGPEGDGVIGLSIDGYGVYGSSNNSFGVCGSTNSATSYAGYFFGDVWTTGLYQGSDLKLKKNIKEVDNALDIIRQLKPKNFEYREDGSFKQMNLPNGKHYGFIAQDLEKVLPNLVKESEFDTKNSARFDSNRIASEQNTKTEPASSGKEKKGEIIDFKAVNYVELIPIIVKAIQEQNIKIEGQQKQNEDLKKQIDELKTMVQSLAKGTVVDVANTALLSEASLEQNAPNPFSKATTINYSLPQSRIGGTSAKIIVIDESGKTIKIFNLSGTGKGSINFSSPFRVGASYQYSLFVDGRLIDTKQMVLTK